MSNGHYELFDVATADLVHEAKPETKSPRKQEGAMTLELP